MREEEQLRYEEVVERYLPSFSSEYELRWAVEELLDREIGSSPGRRSHLIRDLEFKVDVLRTLDEWSLRRSSGEPLQYILGHWPFGGLDLICDTRALIPRPETEELVELIASEAKNDGRLGMRVLDLGCGTGAIGLSLAATGLVSYVELVDFSEAACELTRENLRRNLELIRCDVEIVQSDWFEDVRESKFDLVVSNPPYIRSGDIEVLQAELSMEPVSALDGGEDGIAPYRLILSQVRDFLKAGGKVYFEIGFDQGKAVSKLAREAGFEDVLVVKDLASHDRFVICARLSGD